MPPGLTSPLHLIVIVVVALVVLGPERLPAAMHQVGRAMAEVRRLSASLQDEVKHAMTVTPADSERAPAPAEPTSDKGEGATGDGGGPGSQP